MIEALTTPPRINPIKFPTITMMVGGDPQGNLDLAKSLCARDSDLETACFASPAIDATSVALTGTYHLSTNLPLGKSDADSMDLYHKMCDLLEPRLVPLAIERISEDIGTYFCARVVFLDATYPRVLEMQKHFKTEELAVIQLGALQSPPTGLSLWKHVWLPSPSIMERMSLLEREFGLIDLPAEEE